MARVALARLYDIETTVAKLIAITKSRTQADLSSDWLFNQACHYALQTIGEAANHLPPDLYDRYHKIPWRKIVGLSHKLRHEYFRIDPDVIWLVLVDHLPPLRDAIQTIIDEAFEKSQS